MGGHAVLLSDSAHPGHPRATRLFPRKASWAHQAPHSLLLAPQPRRPVRTATSPVATATASQSGGSVTARRSVPTAPMSLRPCAVSSGPRAGGRSGGSASSSDPPCWVVGRLSGGDLSDTAPDWPCAAPSGAPGQRPGVSSTGFC